MHYDAAAAERVVRFIRLLKHSRGRFAGQPFELLPFQAEDIVRPLFGTLRDNGTRQFRRALIGLARKSGKSQLGAALALYLLLADREHGAEVYSAAVDREQARRVHDAGKEMVLASPFAKHVTVLKNSIVVPSTNSVWKVLSAEAPQAHGANPSAVILDETWAQPNRDLYDALTTGQGARRQPLIINISTAGFDQNSLLYELYDYGRKVEAGVVDDPQFFFYWRAANAEADWKLPETWRAAHPALGTIVPEEFLESEAREASEIPARQNTFRQLYLNQWTAQRTRWLDLAVWDENLGGYYDEEMLAGQVCYGGLDLASVSDLTAWILVFPNEDGSHDVLCRFFLPEGALQQGRNKQLYRTWADQGYLTVTPGDATDYGFVKKQVLEDATQYNLHSLALDALFQGAQLGGELLENGLDVVAFKPTFMGFAAASKEFETLLLNRKLHHGGNPILRWHADNVTAIRDANDNVRPDRQKSTNKIDGIVALLMALDRAIRHEDNTSVYETRGLQVW